MWKDWKLPLLLWFVVGTCNVVVDAADPINVRKSVESACYERKLKDSQCPIGTIPISYVNMESQFERRAAFQVSLHGCRSRLTRIPAVDAANETDLLTRWPSLDYMKSVIRSRGDPAAKGVRGAAGPGDLEKLNLTQIIDEYLRVRGGRSRGEAALVFGHTYAVKNLFENTDDEYGVSVEDDAILSLSRLHFHTLREALKRVDGPLSRTPDWAVLQLFANGVDDLMIDGMRNFELLADTSVKRISRWGTVALAYNRKGMEFQLERQMDQDRIRPRCPMDIQPCVADLALRKQYLALPPWAYNRLIEQDSGLRHFRNSDGRAHQSIKTGRHHRLAARNIQVALQHFELVHFIGASLLGTLGNAETLLFGPDIERSLYKILTFAYHLVVDLNSPSKDRLWYKRWVKLMTHTSTPKIVWTL